MIKNNHMFWLVFKFDFHITECTLGCYYINCSEAYQWKFELQRLNFLQRVVVVLFSSWMSFMVYLLMLSLLKCKENKDGHSYGQSKNDDEFRFQFNYAHFSMGTKVEIINTSCI